MNVQSMIAIYKRDRWSWMYIPAIILFSSFFVNLIIGGLITSNVKIYTGGVTSIFIYIFVLGILVLAQTFPFAIGMSIRRIDFFIGTVLMGLIASLIIGILLYILSFIEDQTDGWGGILHFFHFTYVNEGSFFTQISLYVIVLSHLFLLGFLISSFARRFGGKGMLIGALASLLIVSTLVLLINQNQSWGKIFQWFTTHTAIEIAYFLIPISLIYLVASYLLLRRATI